MHPTQSVFFALGCSTLLPALDFRLNDEDLAVIERALPDCMTII